MKIELKHALMTVEVTKLPNLLWEIVIYSNGHHIQSTRTSGSAEFAMRKALEKLREVSDAAEILLKRAMAALA